MDSKNKRDNGGNSKDIFLNYNTGFCGANNTLYKTINAGNNWELKGQFVQILTSICFINENTGWLGFNGYHLRFTSNGGTNWIDQTLPFIAGTPIYDIYFFNSSTGYAGYGFDKILKTTNGGLSWGYQIDTGGSLHIAFADTSKGWTANFLGITHTTNGGGPIIYTGFVNNGSIIPKQFTLYQNYPNPFNPTTIIKLDLPKNSDINLVICDMLGRELYKLANEYLKAGSYSFTWNASKYSSGIYFYRLTTNNHSETRKMILIK